MHIHRIILQDLLKELPREFISILIGPRQAGKSFLLREIEKTCAQKGLKTAFYNLEDPEHLRLFSKDDAEIITHLTTGVDILFLDEFHYLKNATKIFKAIYDSQKKVKIFASGSSSLEIHKHLKESLAGRYRLTRIFPLSFQEARQQPNFTLEHYLTQGGMPGLIHESTLQEKMALLKNIVESYILKDIKALIREENIRAFNQLMYLIAQNQGSVVSLSSLAREVGLSEPAVAKHFDILANTYVCYPLESFSRNLANELKKSKKYYLYDLGIRNSLLRDFSKPARRSDKGAIVETFVFLTLLRQLKPNMEIKFWRTKQQDEIDFILLKNRIPCPVEVKFILKDCIVPPAFKKFFKYYPESPSGIVVSKDFKKELVFEGRRVHFIPLGQVEELGFLKD